MNAWSIANAYARNTPWSWSAGTMLRSVVAPLVAMWCASTPVVYLGIVFTSTLVKTFWATEIEMAPPRVLAKRTMASR